MTAQISESLYYEGKKQSMCSNPLTDYFTLCGVEPPFESNCTALWRGYVGTWEIKDRRLYLIGLRGTLMDGSEANLATIFPDFPDRVFAHWYSGTLRVPQGKQLQYVHMGYDSTFERDLFIDIKNGVIEDINIVNNGASGNEQAPEGYGIAAMILLASHPETDKGQP